MKSAWSKVSGSILRAESQYPTRLGAALPLAAITVVIAADLLAGRDHYLTPGIVVAPALAALTLRWRGTLAICLLGAGVQGLLAPYDGATDIPDHDVLWGQLFAYAVVSLFSIFISWRRETGARRFTAISSVAEAAQRALMAPPPPHVGTMRLAVRYVSAAADAQIGGDLYAVMETPHGVRVLVGDVRGKGLPAVQASSVVLGSFREASYDAGGLGEVAARVERSVRRHVTTGEFVTALFAQFDRPDSVELLHYGHVAPLRVGRDGSVRTLDPPDPWVPLGLADMVEGEPTPWRSPLLSGEVLVLCTDGVIEARNPKDQTFYPLTERVGQLIIGCGRDLDRAVERIYEDLLRHAGGSLSDDVVLLLLAPQEAGARQARVDPSAEIG